MFLSLSVFGFSQEYSKEIETQFRDYTQMIMNKNFEQALNEYANEDFLKIVPKEQMLETMNEVFNSKEMEFKTYEPQNIVVINNVLEAKNKTYIQLNYDQRIDMKFNSKEIPKEQLLAALQREFGSDKVKFNDATKFYEIQSHKNAIASSVDLKKWKFTVLEKNQFQLLAQFLPKELLVGLN